MIAKLTDWTQVGDKPFGGNPGAVHDAPCGTRYFVKGNRCRTPADALTSDIHAQCEVLAGKLLA